MCPSVGARIDPATAVADRGVPLRRMGEEDLDAILAIETESFAAPWPRSTFELAITTRELLCLVACPFGVTTDPGGLAADEESVAGYLIVCPDRQDALIANVAVARAYRRLGYGRRLVEAALRWAVDRGAKSCRLDVRMSNTGAQRLYERLGFRSVGRRRGYYPNPREDAVTMERVLVI